MATGYSLHLILDTRETFQRSFPNSFQIQLESMGVRCERRALNIGDFAWIVRDNTIGNEGKEWMCDWIVERKAFDDLIASIKDARLVDQKLRLTTTSFKHLVYLVEMPPPPPPTRAAQPSHLNNQGPAVRTTLAQLQLHPRIFLKQTSNAVGTLQYLQRLTLALEKRLGESGLDSILAQQDGERLEFEKFHRNMDRAKNLKLEIVTRNMLRCIKGVSMEKAVAITRTYPTMRSLIKALHALPTAEEQEALLRSAGGTGRKAIPAALAKKMRTILCARSYDAEG
ncbi:restriction endonuclease type II-like protein [Gaertneriomyces semiglobifer]|nr:restriction endonuclease type II-like protein [Gaertneriomyces semiglobifer]